MNAVATSQAQWCGDCAARGAALEAELAVVQAKVAMQEQELAELRRRLAAAQEIAFKPRESFRVPPLEDDPRSAGAPQGGPRPRGQQRGARGHGRRLHPQLPTEDVILQPDPSDLRCPNCGAPRVRIPGTADTEILDWRQSARRVLYHRPRYVDTCNCKTTPAVIGAPPPLRPIPRGNLSAAFLANLLVLKFALALPLERILLLLSVQGLDLSPGSVTGMFERIIDYLRPLHAAYLAHHLEANAWHLDETRWKVWTKEWPSPNGWLWVAVSLQVIVFIIDPHRSIAALRRLFPQDANARGLVQSDMYVVYTENTFDPDRFTMIKCWAHVRRHIFRAATTDQDLAVWSRHWIERVRQMYRLVRARRRSPDDPSHQAALEAHLDKMFRTLSWQLRQPASDAKRKVLEMMAWHWHELVAFAHHPDAVPDNNAAERALRRPALGRKNYQGSRAAWAADLAAAMFSISETLRLWNIDPVDYLTRYLDACALAGGRAPADLTPFLPWQTPRGPAP